MDILVCMKTKAAYLDVADALVCGADVVNAEEHTIEVAPLVTIVHRAAGNQTTVHRHIEDALDAGMAPGTTLTILPVVRPPT